MARVLLGVTGGIAAYKACELTRLLVRAGHQVIPLVTRGAVEIFRHDWGFDSTDAIRDLGYTITPLAQGIRETVKSLSPPDRIGSR